jgi:hypothetical protein
MDYFFIKFWMVLLKIYYFNLLIDLLYFIIYPGWVIKIQLIVFN